MLIFFPCNTWMGEDFIIYLELHVYCSQPRCAALISSQRIPGGIHTHILKKVYKHVKENRDMYLVVFGKYPYISIHII